MTKAQFVDYINREIAPFDHVPFTKSGRVTWKQVIIRNRDSSHFYLLVLNLTSFHIQMKLGYLAHQLPTTWRISIYQYSR